MKPLVIIPARGGSKGVPGKNIKLLDGKPLIQYTIEAAREVFEDQSILVTTDDQDIKYCVEEMGLIVPFLRPVELASDIAGTYEVLLHALSYYEAQGNPCDVVILLQPTSPLRKSKHIIEALKLYNDNLDMVVSVKETKANPYYVLFEESDNGFLRKSKEGNFTRRQDCPKVWEYNGAIYIINTDSLKNQPINHFDRIMKYEMSKISSIDIDDELDWVIANEIIKR